MKTAKISTLYFNIIEIVVDVGFCPQTKHCIVKKDKEVCIECISEYILRTGKFEEKLIDEIMGK